jgi:hypothetical protein
MAQMAIRFPNGVLEAVDEIVASRPLKGSTAARLFAS